MKRSLGLVYNWLLNEPRYIRGRGKGNRSGDLRICAASDGSHCRQISKWAANLSSVRPRRRARWSKAEKAARFKAVTLLLMSDMLMELLEGRVPCAGGGVRFSADRNR